MSAVSAARPHVTVCVCTYRRPQMLARLLRHLQGLATDDAFDWSVVVADNDPAGSARPVVDAAAASSVVPIVYTAEPVPNIARARNAALRCATGEFVAFIDDDEFPDPHWLATLVAACRHFDVAGVLGPVRPHFDEPPPRWVVDGGFCERPEHPTGHVLTWGECRTGNVLLRRAILPSDGVAFDEAFGIGGEDGDFFLRMIERGHGFRWCNEAVVYETVPPERWRRRYMLERALLRGSLTMDLPGSHLPYLLRAAVAVPTYLIAIPLASIVSRDAAMKVCIRLCDHAGVLLAACGFRPVRAR
jgi:succinoglycan biosynthesis protein ExoM